MLFLAYNSQFVGTSFTLVFLGSMPFLSVLRIFHRARSVRWRLHLTFGALKSHRYIGNIVVSKIVISGLCTIHLTVTFDGTWHIYIHVGALLFDSYYMQVQYYCILILITNIAFILERMFVQNISLENDLSFKRMNMFHTHSSAQRLGMPQLHKSTIHP